MKNLEVNEFKNYADKKDELEEFFSNIIFKPADREMLQILINRKEEFINWLSHNNLKYLINNMDSVQPLSDLEWECAKRILSILEKFDYFINQCNHLDKNVQYEYYLRRRMGKLDISFII